MPAARERSIGASADSCEMAAAHIEGRNNLVEANGVAATVQYPVSGPVRGDLRLNDSGLPDSFRPSSAKVKNGSFLVGQDRSGTGQLASGAVEPSEVRPPQRRR